MSNQPQPTLRDIATACGVHYSTVSLALRKDPRIAQQTIEKVLKVANALGYRPDPSITSLMTRIRMGKHNTYRETLAWVTCPTQVDDWRNNRAFLGFYRGAHERARALGYKLNLIEDRNLIRTRLYEVLRTRGIRGVVFSTLFEVDEVSRMDWEKIVAVQIEPHNFLPTFPTLSNDQSQALREGFRRAKELGYKRIGMAINGVWDLWVRNAWFSGYLMDSHLLPPQQRLEPFGIYEWNIDAFAKWFYSQKPDLILTIDRRYVWKWLAQMKLEVPRDVAYIDLDRHEPNPAIAGIQQNHEAVGAAAISLLVSRLYHNETGPDASRTTTRIEGNWHDGASAPPNSLRTPSRTRAPAKASPKASTQAPAKTSVKTPAKAAIKKPTPKRPSLKTRAKGIRSTHSGEKLE